MDETVIGDICSTLIQYLLELGLSAVFLFQFPRLIYLHSDVGLVDSYALLFNSLGFHYLKYLYENDIILKVTCIYIPDNFYIEYKKERFLSIL